MPPKASCETDRVTWAAVVLAGGTAARLDGTDKAALVYDGRSLLEVALAAVAGAAQTIVVGDPVSTSRPVTFTREEPPRGGPLAGLRAGVIALDGPPGLVVVTAVDMPHLTRDTVNRLVAAAEGVDGSWLVDSGGRWVLAGAVRTEHVLAIREPHGLPMRSLVGSLRLHEVPAEGDEAADVDTWADVERLRAGNS